MTIQNAVLSRWKPLKTLYTGALMVCIALKEHHVKTGKEPLKTGILYVFVKVHGLRTFYVLRRRSQTDSQS